MNKAAWIAKAKELGFEAFEIYEARERERTVRWYEGKMDNFTTSDVKGTSLRGIVDGKMAYLALEHVNDDAMDDALKEMRAQAKVLAGKDPEILRAPQEAPPAAPGRTFIQPAMEDILNLLSAFEAKAKAYDARVKQVSYLEWIEETSERSIVNSLGLDIQDGNVAQVLFAGVIVSDGKEMKDDYHFEIVEDLAKLDLDKAVKKTCDGALDKLGAGPVPSGTYDLILEKGAMSSLFGALSGMFSGDLIYKGISPLREGTGRQIFSEKITVVDDPGCPEAMGRYRFDDEGCPTRAKKLVDKGVFTTILHSTKTGARVGAESTGNGFKAGYAASVDVHPQNCYIVPGEKDLDALCEQMGNGLVILDMAGLHAGLNPVTTDFSLQCSGYLVKDGKKDRPVSLITVAANFMELMNRVEAVGNDLEWKYSSFACPSILFKDCAVSGE